MARLPAQEAKVTKTRAAVALAAVFACLLAARPASAAPPVPAQWEEAAKLLDEGRELMIRPATLDKACEVLERSYSLRKRGDTLLNLAECHRRQGKTATAWREFDEAIRVAKEVEFGEAIRAAQVHRDQLAKLLSELVVEVPQAEARPDGLAILLDGLPLPEQQWGTVLYVDPGTHRVEASAPDFRPFSGSAEVVLGGKRSTIQVELVALPKPPPPPKEPPPPPPKPVVPPVEPEAPVWALVVGGIGVAMMGVSVGFLVDSLAAGEELDLECGTPDRNACDLGYDFEPARGREVRGFGLFVGLGAAGVAAVGAGAIGLALGLNPPDAPVAFVPWGLPGGGGGVMVGRF
jgi:hypothetical protein